MEELETLSGGKSNDNYILTSTKIPDRVNIGVKTELSLVIPVTEKTSPVAAVVFSAYRAGTSEQGTCQKYLHFVPRIRKGFVGSDKWLNAELEKKGVSRCSHGALNLHENEQEFLLRKVGNVEPIRLLAHTHTGETTISHDHFTFLQEKGIIGKKEAEIMEEIRWMNLPTILEESFAEQKGRFAHFCSAQAQRSRA